LVEFMDLGMWVFQSMALSPVLKKAYMNLQYPSRNASSIAAIASKDPTARPSF